MGVPLEIVDRLRRATDAARAVESHRGEGRILPGTSLTVTVTSGGLEEVERPMRMRVEDFSPGGIGLLHFRPLSVGGAVILELPGGPGAVPVRVHGAVSSCHAVADGIYRLGVRFEHVEP